MGGEQQLVGAQELKADREAIRGRSQGGEWCLKQLTHPSAALLSLNWLTVCWAAPAACPPSSYVRQHGQVITGYYSSPPAFRRLAVSLHLHLLLLLQSHGSSEARCQNINIFSVYFCIRKQDCVSDSYLSCTAFDVSSLPVISSLPPLHNSRTTSLHDQSNFKKEIHLFTQTKNNNSKTNQQQEL